MLKLNFTICHKRFRLTWAECALSAYCSRFLFLKYEISFNAKIIYRHFFKFIFELKFPALVFPELKRDKNNKYVVYLLHIVQYPDHPFIFKYCTSYEKYFLYIYKIAII